MRKLLFLLSLMALIPLANGGCESTAATSGSEEETVEDGEPAGLTGNGGYDTEDEAPMFGLPSMGQFGADPEAGDPSLTGEEEAADEAVESAQVYLLRMVWGNLELNGFEGEDRAEPHPDWLDWSGTLVLEGKGGLILKRTILFDRHDRIVPEDDRHRIEWISRTGPHIDGLLVKVIYLPHPEATEPSIIFTTGLVTQTIPIAALDHYNEIVLIDEDGHGAAFTALRVGDDDCLEGFLAGKWHDRPEGEGGVFRGRVLSERGALNGHIRGHYGVNDEGDPVFFGKYINTTGHFRGLLRGTYGGGAFEGDWVAADGALEGTLNGKYVTGAEVDQGFFQGFWEEACE
jgi:hypothetical protein